MRFEDRMMNKDVSKDVSQDWKTSVDVMRFYERIVEMKCFGWLHFELDVSARVQSVVVETKFSETWVVFLIAPLYFAWKVAVCNPNNRLGSHEGNFRPFEQVRMEVQELDAHRSK